MAKRGELLTLGRHVVDLAEFLGVILAEYGAPGAIVCGSLARRSPAGSSGQGEGSALRPGCTWAGIQATAALTLTHSVGRACLNGQGDA